MKQAPIKSILLIVIVFTMSTALSFHLKAQQKGEYDYGKDGFAHEHSLAVPICLAKYSNGDWDYNSHFDAKGNIVAGGLFHLLASMNKWSRGNINVAVAWIDCSRTNWPKNLPPIIVFRGTKDFSLTNQEIENLRSFVHMGGMIWGDNSSGQADSKFDIAFHREIKRVISVSEKNLQTVSSTNPIYSSCFDLKDSSTKDQIIEDIELNGARAVIYTPHNLLDGSERNEQLGMNIICQTLVRY